MASGPPREVAAKGRFRTQQTTTSGHRSQRGRVFGVVAGLPLVKARRRPGLPPFPWRSDLAEPRLLACVGAALRGREPAGMRPSGAPPCSRRRATERPPLFVQLQPIDSSDRNRSRHARASAAFAAVAQSFKAGLPRSRPLCPRALDPEKNICRGQDVAAKG
jgi:hypothetical protein